MDNDVVRFDIAMEGLLLDVEPVDCVHQLAAPAPESFWWWSGCEGGAELVEIAVGVVFEEESDDSVVGW